MELLRADEVLTISGVPPDRGHVAALARDGDVALATVVTNDEEEKLLWAGELQWNPADGWHEEPIASGHEVLAAGGRHRDHPRGAVTVEYLGRTVEVPVSAGGWWAFVVQVEDHDAAYATWSIDGYRGDVPVRSAEPDVADADHAPPEA